MKIFGLDVHQARISVVVMDSRGKLIMEAILETKASTILEFLGGLAWNFIGHLRRRNLGGLVVRPSQTACSQWVACNPRKNAALNQGNRSDKTDARELANRVRLNDLKPVYHGQNGVRMLCELARSYLTIVKDLSRVRL